MDGQQQIIQLSTGTQLNGHFNVDDTAANTTALPDTSITHNAAEDLSLHLVLQVYSMSTGGYDNRETVKVSLPH